MSDLTIRTNNQPRRFLEWGQLTEREQAVFNSQDEDSRFGRAFIRYRGRAYDLFLFFCCPPDQFPPCWSCYCSDYNDYHDGGVVARWTWIGPYRDPTHVVMGTYYS